MVAFYSALSGDKDGLEQDRPHLQLKPAQVDAALHAARACRRAATYVFAPGAEYGPAKRWPAEHFAELARALERAGGAAGLRQGESDLCQEIAARPGAGKCLNLAGKTSLAATRSR